MLNFLLITILALLLRIFAATYFPLSPDEAHHILMAKNSNLLYLAQVAIEAQLPPLYFYLLHFWELISSNLFFIRLSSVIIGTVTVICLAVVTYKLFSIKTSFLISFLAAVSPSFIYYSSIARMYSLSILLFTLIFYLYIKLGYQIKYSILFTFLMILGLYTHFFFVILLIMLNIHYLVFRRKTHFKVWVLINICIGIFFLPAVYLVVNSKPFLATPIYTFYKLPFFFMSSILPWDLVQNQILDLWQWHKNHSFVGTSLTVISIVLIIGLHKKLLKEPAKTISFIYFLTPLLILALSYNFISIANLRSFTIFSPCFYLILASKLTSQNRLLKSTVASMFLLATALLFLKTDSITTQTNFYLNFRQDDIILHNDPTTFVETKILNIRGEHYLMYPGAYDQAILDALNIKLTNLTNIPRVPRIWYIHQQTNWPPFEKNANTLEYNLSLNYNEESRVKFKKFQLILYSAHLF